MEHKIGDLVTVILNETGVSRMFKMGMILAHTQKKITVLIDGELLEVKKDEIGPVSFLKMRAQSSKSASRSDKSR